MSISPFTISYLFQCHHHISVWLTLIFYPKIFFKLNRLKYWMPLWYISKWRLPYQHIFITIT